MAGRAEWADYFGNGPECLSPDIRRRIERARQATADYLDLLAAPSTRGLGAAKTPATPGRAPDGDRGPRPDPDRGRSVAPEPRRGLVVNSDGDRSGREA
ncbi:hypothetical protein AB1484_25395 [Parafrankia sp. FMc6]|uniref:hypothetical protein n=1 Tax=Parafrankia soli TaxID=2599596 RepID=UPI0034D77723